MLNWQQAANMWFTDSQHLHGHCLQIVKQKIKQEDGRGRFKTTSDKPLRIADREKKPALKT